MEQMIRKQKRGTANINLPFLFHYQYDSLLALLKESFVMRISGRAQAIDVEYAGTYLFYTICVDRRSKDLFIIPGFR